MVGWTDEARAAALEARRRKAAFTKRSLLLWHGSPNPDIRTYKSHSNVAFGTFYKQEALAYAKRQIFGAGHTKGDTPTLYRMRVARGAIFDMRRPDHQRLYDAARSRWNAAHKDWDYQLPKRGPGFVMSNGLPGYGHVQAMSTAISAARGKRKFVGMWINEGGNHTTSLAVFNPKRNVRMYGGAHRRGASRRKY